MMARSCRLFRCRHSRQMEAGTGDIRLLGDYRDQSDVEGVTRSARHG